MATNAEHINVNAKDFREIPRMISDTDIALIRQVASRLPKRARILEFGPWLGGVSAHLAEFGKLHVVDRFIWTDKNAERLPGVAEPGDSFLPVFKKILKDHKIRADIYPTDFRALEWDIGPVDMCFIDAPRKPDDLLDCLRPIAESLHQDSLVLVKNGLNPAHFNMVALIEVLLAQSIFELVQVEQPKWCNIAVLKTGAKFARFHDLCLDEEFFENNPLGIPIRDPWGGTLFPTARLAHHVDALDWDAAYDQLDRITPDIANIYAWDDQSEHFDIPSVDAARLITFSEALAFHNDPASASGTRIPFERSAALGLRAYWKRNRHLPWRKRVLPPTTISVAFQQGRMDWPAMLESHIQQRTVLEIGPDLGLSGVGYLVAGARSYIGIETGAEPGDAEKASDEDLPAWLRDRLAELGGGFRVHLRGEPAQQVDYCLMHDAGDDTSTFASALAKTLNAASPGTEFYRLSEGATRSLISGLDG